MTEKKIIDVYEELTGEKLNPEACDKLSIWLAGRDLEAKLSDESDTELIKELTTNPIYLHNFHGYTDGDGFHGKKTIGDISRYTYIRQQRRDFDFEWTDEGKKIMDDLDERYKSTQGVFWCYEVWPDAFPERGHPFKERVSGFNESASRIPKEFEARLFGFNLANGDYMLQMWYNDTTNATRLICHHRYLLFLPKDKKAEIVPKIKEKPELMIELFKTLFEEFDNSKGKMKLDSNFKHLIEAVEGS